MTTAASCTVTTLHIEGVPYPMPPHKASGADRCGDCGVAPGGYHHLGCDLARCPRCRRQLISCGCPFDELDDGGDGLPWTSGCPRCGSESVIPILYGLRNPTLIALADRGLLELGDAKATGHPTSRCRSCHHAWTRGRRSA